MVLYIARRLAFPPLRPPNPSPPPFLSPDVCDREECPLLQQEVLHYPEGHVAASLGGGELEDPDVGGPILGGVG